MCIFFACDPEIGPFFGAYANDSRVLRLLPISNRSQCGQVPRNNGVELVFRDAEGKVIERSSRSVVGHVRHRSLQVFQTGGCQRRVAIRAALMYCFYLVELRILLDTEFGLGAVVA